MPLPGRSVPQSSREMMITISALGIESTALRDRFKKCRFLASVLADEEGDVAAKLKVDAAREGFDVEGVP